MWADSNSKEFDFLDFPVQFSRCAVLSVRKAGGLKWTRTTDLTLIRRVL